MQLFGKKHGALAVRQLALKPYGSRCPSLHICVGLELLQTEALPYIRSLHKWRRCGCLNMLHKWSFSTLDGRCDVIYGNYQNIIIQDYRARCPLCDVYLGIVTACSIRALLPRKFLKIRDLANSRFFFVFGRSLCRSF